MITVQLHPLWWMSPYFGETGRAKPRTYKLVSSNNALAICLPTVIAMFNKQRDSGMPLRTRVLQDQLDRIYPGLNPVTFYRTVLKPLEEQGWITRVPIRKGLLATDQMPRDTQMAAQRLGIELPSPARRRELVARRVGRREVDQDAVRGIYTQAIKKRFRSVNPGDYVNYSQLVACLEKAGTTVQEVHLRTALRNCVQEGWLGVSRGYGCGYFRKGPIPKG